MNLDRSIPDPHSERLSDLAEEITGRLTTTEAPTVREQTLRDRIEAALDASIDNCARCKICGQQIDAVMAAIRASGLMPADDQVVALVVEIPDVGTARVLVLDISDEGRTAADVAGAR